MAITGISHAAAVTADLLDVLVDTETHIKNLNGAGDKVNDHMHFESTARVLEKLVLAIRTVQANESLLFRTETCARFSTEPKSHVMTALNDAAAYLRRDAAELIAKGSFSSYKGEQTGVVRDKLVRLFGELVGSIRGFASHDLTRIQLQHGVYALAMMAATVAGPVRGDDTTDAQA